MSRWFRVGQFWRLKWWSASAILEQSLIEEFCGFCVMGRLGYLLFYRVDRGACDNSRLHRQVVALGSIVLLTVCAQLDGLHATYIHAWFISPYRQSLAGDVEARQQLVHSLQIIVHNIRSMWWQLCMPTIFYLRRGRFHVYARHQWDIMMAKQMQMHTQCCDVKKYTVFVKEERALHGSHVQMQCFQSH